MCSRALYTWFTTAGAYTVRCCVGFEPKPRYSRQRNQRVCIPNNLTRMHGYADTVVHEALPVSRPLVLSALGVVLLFLYGRSY